MGGGFSASTRWLAKPMLSAFVYLFVYSFFFLLSFWLAFSHLFFFPPCLFTIPWKLWWSVKLTCDVTRLISRLFCRCFTTPFTVFRLRFNHRFASTFRFACFLFSPLSFAPTRIIYVIHIRLYRCDARFPLPFFSVFIFVLHFTIGEKRFHLLRAKHICIYTYISGHVT